MISPTCRVGRNGCHRISLHAKCTPATAETLGTPPRQLIHNPASTVGQQHARLAQGTEWFAPDITLRYVVDGVGDVPQDIARPTAALVSALEALVCRWTAS
jgi:hypothetical protein